MPTKFIGRASHRRQPGLIGQSFRPTPTPPHQRDQASLGKASSSTPTRSYAAERPYRRQLGLIRQSFTPTPTRPHQAKFSHQCQIGINAIQASSGRASTSTPTKHKCQPGLIRQSFYTNYSKASSGRASIPTPTKPYQAELHTNANKASSGRAFISTLTRSYQAELSINTNQALLGCTSMYIRFKRKLKL